MATKQDQHGIQKVYSGAFPGSESRIVSKLAIDLLSETTTLPTISLVAENDEAIVGHIAFSPVQIDNNENIQGYILAPLAVHPGYQKRRIGSRLIDHGMQLLSDMGVNVVLVYGDPAYYGRFGFSVDATDQYIPPYKLEYPFGWQARVLKECDIKAPSVSITCVESLCDPQLW
jgi:putative acetyltransferase